MCQIGNQLVLAPCGLTLNVVVSKSKPHPDVV